MNFYDGVYEIVAKIPRGRVVSYGQIASWLGCWRASRAVGAAMARAPRERALPCHRVIRSDGTLASPNVFGPGVQRRLLEKEGVVFTLDGRVDMRVSAWDGLKRTSGRSKSGPRPQNAHKKKAAP